MSTFLGILYVIVFALYLLFRHTGYQSQEDDADAGRKCESFLFKAMIAIGIAYCVSIC